MHIKLQELTSNAIRVIREKTAEKFGVLDGGAKFKQIMAEFAKIVHDESDTMYHHKFYSDVLRSIDSFARIDDDEQWDKAISDLGFVLDRRHPEMAKIVKTQCNSIDEILEFHVVQTEELYGQLIGLSE